MQISEIYYQLPYFTQYLLNLQQQQQQNLSRYV